MAIRFSAIVKDAKGNNIYVDIYDDDYTSYEMDIMLREQGINIRQDADENVYSTIRS